MNKKIFGIGAVIVVICAVIFFAAFHKTKSAIRIGVIDVLSGEKAPAGESFKKGIELAKADYIKSHPDAKIELVYADDASDSKKGVEAFDKLVKTDQVSAVIVATSPTITAIASSSSASSLPILSYGAEASVNAKDGIFHLFPDAIVVDSALGALVKSLTASAPGAVVGVYTSDPVLTNFYGAFQEGLGSDITEFNLDENMKDMKSVAQKVLAKNPKYIFMSNYADLGASFIKELKALSGGKIKQTFIFDLTLNESLADYQKVLGDLKFLDGSLVVSMQKASDIEAYGYDALNILLASQDSSVSGWIGKIQDLKIMGKTGDIHFDSVGRRIPAFAVGTLKDGKIPDFK